MYASHLHARTHFCTRLSLPVVQAYSCEVHRQGMTTAADWLDCEYLTAAGVGVQVSNHTITILLGLVFSVINPLLPLICVLYFCIIYLTERYNMLYAERPVYHAGGQGGSWWCCCCLAASASST